HRHFPIPQNAEHRNCQPRQACQRLARHRPRQHVAAHHNCIHLEGTHLFQHRLQRRQVPVNVVNRRDAPRRHHPPPQRRPVPAAAIFPLFSGPNCSSSVFTAAANCGSCPASHDPSGLLTSTSTGRGCSS